MASLRRGALVFSLVLALAPSLAAEDAVADLKKQGDEAMKAMHYREALDAYDRAYGIRHDPAILYNRARSLEALGQYPRALDSLEEFVRIAPDELKARVPKLADLLADVRSRVAFVAVTSSVPGATILIGNKIEGTTPLSAPLRVPSGDAVIEVQAAGYASFRQQAKLVGGQLITVDAHLEKQGEPSAATPEAAEKSTTEQPTATPPMEQPKAGPTPLRAVGYTIGAVGLAGLALGGVFGGLVAVRKGDADPHCPGKVCDSAGLADISDARTFATVSTVGFIAGAALVTTSVVILVVAARRPSTGAAFVPMLGPGFVGARGVF